MTETDPRVKRIEDFIERFHNFEIVVNERGMQAKGKGLISTSGFIFLGSNEIQEFLKDNSQLLVKKMWQTETYSEFLARWISNYEDVRGELGDVPINPNIKVTQREVAIASLSMWIARGYANHFLDEGQSLTKRVKDLQDERAGLYQEIEQLSSKLPNFEKEKLDCQKELSDLRDKTRNLTCPNCREPINVEDTSTFKSKVESGDDSSI